MVDAIIDIDLARDVKDFINNSDDVFFLDVAMKDKIFGTDNDKLLRVEKTISSPTKIIKVDVVDDVFKG